MVMKDEEVLSCPFTFKFVLLLVHLLVSLDLYDTSDQSIS